MKFLIRAWCSGTVVRCRTAGGARWRLCLIKYRPPPQHFRRRRATWRHFISAAAVLSQTWRWQRQTWCNGMCIVLRVIFSNIWINILILGCSAGAAKCQLFLKRIILRHIAEKWKVSTNKQISWQWGSLQTRKGFKGFGLYIFRNISSQQIFYQQSKNSPDTKLKVVLIHYIAASYYIREQPPFLSGFSVWVPASQATLLFFSLFPASPAVVPASPALLSLPLAGACRDGSTVPFTISPAAVSVKCRKT